jgi:hypothetical protein
MTFHGVVIYYNTLYVRFVYIHNRNSLQKVKKKKKKQSLKIDPVHKKTGNVKCNKTITALHFVQYDVLWSTEKQY